MIYLPSPSFSIRSSLDLSITLPENIASVSFEFQHQCQHNKHCQLQLHNSDSLSDPLMKYC